MKRILITLLCMTLVFCGFALFGCDNTEDFSDDGMKLAVGEIYEYAPFEDLSEDEYRLETVTGKDKVRLLGNEIIGVAEGKAVVKAVAGERTEEKVFSVTRADYTLTLNSVRTYVGIDSVLNAAYSQQGKTGDFTYEIISGDSVKLTGNRYFAQKIGMSEILCRDKSNNRVAFCEITVAAHSVDIKLSADVIPVGGRILANPVFSDNVERDLTFKVVSGEDVIEINDYEIIGKKIGEAVVSAFISNEEYRFVLSVTDWNIVSDDIVFYEGGSVVPDIKSEPKGARADYEFEIEGDSVTFDGAVIFGIKPGDAVLVCRDKISGKTARIKITVLKREPIISVKDITVPEGESRLINPIIENLEPDMNVVYTVKTGNSYVMIENGRVYGLKPGVATVECKIEGFDNSAVTFGVTVEKVGYKLTVSAIRMEPSESIRPEPVLLPSKQDAEFTYRILSGADYIEIDDGIIKGVTDGVAVVRCEVKGLSVYYDFAVTVRTIVLDVPEGYVEIADGIYASVAAGRYKNAQTLDFFTNLKRAKIYYTTDCAPVSDDLKNAKIWRTGQTLVQRTGSLDDYKLMQQVDGALDWAGPNKNFSANYVNRIQNANSYPLINLGYVYNVALVDEYGTVIRRTIQSYIIFDTEDFDDIPIISLSMPENSWFDGIPNGRGTSVYNNVYLPDGWNNPADNAARANLEFFDVDGGFSVNTQIKVGGGWSRGRPQRTLHLNFNKDENGNKQQEVHFEIFGDRNCAGAKTKTLNDFTRFRLWNGGSSYESSIRFNDALFQLLAEDLNVGTAAVRPAIVYLNGEFWGMYYMREHYSDAYFKENYKVKKSNVQYFDYTGNTYNVSDGDPEKANAFIAEMNAFLNNPSKNFADDAVFDEFFGKYVDEASLIDLMIVQAYSGNWDFVGNGNNHRCWRVCEPEEGNIYTDGKLRFVLHDLDMGMLGGTLDGIYVNLLSYSNGYTFRKYTLLNRALANEGFRERLYKRAEELMKTTFSYEKASSVLSKLVTSVRPLINYNVIRWAQEQSVSAWEGQINYAYDWLSRRPYLFLDALKKSMAIYDKDENAETEGPYIVYGEREFRVNQFWQGNGSLVGTGRKEIRNLSVRDFELSYTMINNGIRDMGAQFHVKFIYGSGGNDNYVTRFMRNGLEPVVFTDVKGMASSEACYVAGLYEGVHNVKMIKQGASLTVYVDGMWLYEVAIPNRELIGLDIYQHNANMIYRNFVIKEI